MKVKALARTALLAAVIAVCSWIAVPSPVPFTMQTFAVFTALILLGGGQGCGAIALYIALGALGIPVFSGFRGGVGALLGATGGYIVGFLAAGLVFTLFTRFFGHSLPALAVASAAGMAVCYLFGTVWFVVVYTAKTGAMTFGAAFAGCVLPFLLPDAAKIALALLVGTRLRRFISSGG